MNRLRALLQSPLAGRLGLCLLVVACLAARNLRLVTDGRFWGEEATIYFVGAYEKPFSEAFLGCVQGYYSLCCQVAAQLAVRAPLEQAPLVTTWFALAIQALPLLLVWRFVRRRGLARPWAAVALAATLLAQPLHETWLTTTGSQYYLTLAAGLFVLFAEELALPRAGVLLVLAAGLSSPQCAAILPFGWWLAWQRPDRARRWAVILLTLAIGLQAVVHLTTTAGWQPRVGLPPSIAIGALFVKCYAMPVVGPDLAGTWGWWLQWHIHEGSFWPWAPMLVLPMIGLWWLCWRCVAARWLLALGHALLLMGVVGSLGDKLSLVSSLTMGRYAIAANALHLLALVLVVQQSARRWPRWFGGVVLGVCLVQGAIEYAMPRVPCAEGPDWGAEVAGFRVDPQRPLKVWPEPWLMTLSPPAK